MSSSDPRIPGAPPDGDAFSRDGGVAGHAPSDTLDPVENDVPFVATPVSAPPAPPAPAPPRETFWQRAFRAVYDYFLGDDPTFWVAMVPLLALSALLYTRHLQTNFIFDEQEALLANPYVHGKNLGWLEAFHRDFWGLPPDRSVGSYRPIPDILWRLVWHISQTSWLHHWINVLLHAANGACVTVFVFLSTRRRGLAWLAGAIFVACAVLTEAVSGVVGIADVLGGLGAMLGLLSLWLPLWAMPFGVAASLLFGLFSKESALVCVPLLPYAAFVLAPLVAPQRPMRALRGALSLVATVGAFVAYVQLRKKLFPAPIEPTLLTPLADGASRLEHIRHGFLVWFHQPPLPKDPLNNPLIKADTAHRIAGALRVYWRGLTQLVCPYTLAGDYSSPQEPIPPRLVFPESVLGALAIAAPPLVSLGLVVRSALVRRRALDVVDDPYAPTPDAAPLLVAVGLMWIVVSYFPHSNIPVLLPTVRAERFWYFPAIGSAVMFAIFFSWLFTKTRHIADGAPAIGLFALFFTFQCGKAYEHSTHYRDDLTFWTATRAAVPNSAKAHLNYSVMWGARGRLDIRLEANRRALELAPEWPMAHVYLGDTLCRLHRPEEAWPNYAAGFEMAENDPNLISLGLQCLWDEQVATTKPPADEPEPPPSDEPGEPPTELGSASAPAASIRAGVSASASNGAPAASSGDPDDDPDSLRALEDAPSPPAAAPNAGWERAFTKHQAELDKLADEHPGSWLAYLVHDMDSNAVKNNGVDPKYRPRGYNEGPKD